jgi:membrane protease YdiL (CAAX protease family)
VRGPVRNGVRGRPLNGIVRQPLVQAVDDLGTRSRLWAYLVVAIAAELVYLAGRTLIRRAFADAIPAELAVTAWRLAFLILYFWLFMRSMRNTKGSRTMPWHPLLLGAVALDLVVGPYAWSENAFDWPTSIVFLLTTPVVALREELFYRAILQGALERTLPPLIAILIAAAAFVLSHIGAQPMNPLTISAITAAGVLLGVIYQRTRNLWLVVTLHTLYDSVALLPNLLLITPFVILIGNVAVIFGGIMWWRLDEERERMG